MKILQIGCGGIGSFLIEEICKCIDQEQIDSFTELVIADNDMAEIDQMTYQNFRVEDMGKNKAQALSKRFKEYGITALKKKITKPTEIRKFDLVILCVDNQPTRKMVVETCFTTGVKTEFIDLRADGRRVFAMPQEKKIEENMKFILDENDHIDTQSYSCQEKQDKDEGRIQKGNKIVAMIGTQMVLNYLRGHNNRIITLLI